MYDYIIGTIKETESGYIVLDNNNVGYKIFVSNPYSFVIDEEIKVYLYEQIREDEDSLYGFKAKEERDLFLRLIDVKGLGPRMALPMFSLGGVELIMNAIETENVTYLKKFPKIGDKVARQIILDLKGKLVSKEDAKNLVDEELVDALKALGYKNADISKVVKNVPNDISIEDKIKEALKLLLK